MRKTVGKIGATLAMLAFIATSATGGALTGIPGLTQISPRAVQPEALSVRLGGQVLNPYDADAEPAAYTAGFPSGRRLADDVTAIELRVIS
jgi:hypothetical protein